MQFCFSSKSVLFQSFFDIQFGKQNQNTWLVYDFFCIAFDILFTHAHTHKRTRTRTRSLNL